MLRGSRLVGSRSRRVWWRRECGGGLLGEAEVRVLRVADASERAGVWAVAGVGQALWGWWPVPLVPGERPGSGGACGGVCAGRSGGGPAAVEAAPEVRLPAGGSGGVPVVQQTCC